MEESISDIKVPVSGSLEPVPKKSVRAVDRVTLGSAEAERVMTWIDQLGIASKGYLDLTKSDVVNFLIREHPQELSLKEIRGIRSSHYDPVRHMNWITPRLKEALAKNDMAQVAILQQEIRSIELSVTSRTTAVPRDNTLAKKSVRKKRKSNDTIEGVKAASTELHGDDF